MPLTSRSIPIHTHKAQVLLQDLWVDYVLAERLYENTSTYGFDFGDAVLDAPADQIEGLIERGLAFKGTRGGYYGTATLVTLVDGQGGLP